MRRTLLTLMIGLGLWNAQAQDPILFEYDWMLVSVRVDGVNGVIPSNSEVNLVELSLGELAAPHDMLTSVCNVLIADNVQYPDIGEIVFSEMAQTLIECTIPSNDVFEGLYFSFFFNHADEVLNYGIGIIDAPEDGDVFDLKITSTSGDILTFLSKPLSLEEFQLNQLVIYPVPAADFLNILNPKGLALQAQIYSMDGRLISAGELTNDRLDISGLVSGVYFLELSSEEGQIVKRFVKN